MKNIIIASSLLISLFFSNITSANIISAGWELWYPYQYRNSQQTLLGLDIEILNAISQEAKYSVEYTELPWKRHLHYVKTGEIDLAMGASKSENRTRYAFFTQPYRLETVKLYVRKGFAGKIKLNSLQDLPQSDYIIGVENGYYYGDEYLDLYKQELFRDHIVEVIDIEENVTMLLDKHIDGFLVDPATIKAFSSKYKMQGEFEEHSLKIYQANIHLMLSKKSITLSQFNQIDNAISTLKSSGKLSQILEKWNKIK